MMDKVFTLAHGHKDIIKLRKKDLEKVKEKESEEKKIERAETTEKAEASESDEEEDAEEFDDEGEEINVCHICKKETECLIWKEEKEDYECQTFNDKQQKYVSLH